MRRLNRSKDFVSTLPKEINQKLVDGYRVRIFAKIKDSLDRKKLALEKEQIELKEFIYKKRFSTLKPANNYWFSRYIRA
ncbi:hypothetical protein [Aliarcobacter cryaerophilus]|uniref:Uncharacterized protein n=1 Tax=Aliarcobacter cryaerophilus TaxID=28198 RepID=A0A2S9TMP2_9BACT|nr:hypothetical protein [Aliarcobacter cryaerophilus]PRN00078.1 hypothetical protein CJ668_08690 [Arcobacter cryaerophilus gv. pseudocryaerophilus]